MNWLKQVGAELCQAQVNFILFDLIVNVYLNPANKKQVTVIDLIKMFAESCLFEKIKCTIETTIILFEY